jgi:hypothetical protein
MLLRIHDLHGADKEVLGLLVLVIVLLVVGMDCLGNQTTAAQGQADHGEQEVSGQ